MRTTIYVKLLNEGTEVYRPVTATHISGNRYQVEGFDIYDPEDELWEFPPGCYVNVVGTITHGETILRAIEG